MTESSLFSLQCNERLLSGHENFAKKSHSIHKDCPHCFEQCRSVRNSSIIVESPPKGTRLDARCIINDVSKLLMAMYSIGLNKDDDEQYGALFKATLRLVRELSPLTSRMKSTMTIPRAMEDSMSIFNVDTFDIDHSRTRGGCNAYRLQEVVTLSQYYTQMFHHSFTTNTHSNHNTGPA